jgi:hypothetical protein
MRASAKGNYLRVRAIAGTHVVVLAWDFVARKPDIDSFTGTRNLLGFAIRRKMRDKKGKVVSNFYLRGMKRFEDKDKGLKPGSLVPTDEHPIQTFQWGDYTVRAGCRYEYTVEPVFGEPKNIVVHEAKGVTVRVICEKPHASGKTARHDVHFNRGIIGSQAYTREFGDAEPDADDPDSEPMKWLSRGLYESLLEFIALGAVKGMGLRAAFYEFHYLPVALALAEAAKEGDVQIVYDAESSYKTENVATLKKAKLTKNAHPRTVTEGIRHNKFIVLMDGDEPVSVWTGSTNISAGGIFGHSNVGHVVHDKAIAQKFLAYWHRLESNLTPTKLRAPNTADSPLPALPLKKGVTAIFSPRDDENTPQADTTLQWYANLADQAQQIVCFTAAFDIAQEFQKVFQKDNDVLRYIVKDDNLIFAAGGYLGEGALANFLAERDNPLNSNDYIHTKYMLVDPLGSHPVVVTGSANFSVSSQTKNDENMLVIKGDTRVADIYFGEFMRLFDHHYARYLSRKYAKAAKSSKGATGKKGGFLAVTAAQWLPPHFSDTSYKAKRRRYFVG